MLGEVEEDLRQAIGVDVIGLWGDYNMFGVKNENYIEYKMYDGTPVLLPKGLNLKKDKNNNTLAFPMGDTSVHPSAKMPESGSFFDNIDRSPPFDEDNLTPLEDFKDDFSIMSDDYARSWEERAKKLFEETDYAIIGNLGGAGLGDAAVIPGPSLKAPQGIRKIDDWLMAHILYPEYTEAVFEMQTTAMLKNLEIYKQAVSDKIQIVWISGTDFGTQNACFVAPDIFRRLYKPFYTRINNWVHKNTSWKTFYHSCGAIYDIIEDITEMGVDIINPVQLSANGMDVHKLKENYGEKLVFWGGGVDTQKTLPMGTDDEVIKQVEERLSILSSGGGYVFNTIHNIVANVPPSNIKTMFDAVKNFNSK